MKMVSKLRVSDKMVKAPYKTKQMTELHIFLKSTKGRHVTVNEICDYFKDKGISVGTTTI